MNFPQGSTIRFLIRFKESTTTEATNFDELDNIIVYAYTEPDNYKVKFSKTTKIGYNTLYRVDALTLLGVITSAQSLEMVGDLYIEQQIKDTLISPVPEDVGKSPIIRVGIIITESNIKTES